MALSQAQRSGSISYRYSKLRTTSWAKASATGTSKPRTASLSKKVESCCSISASFDRLEPCPSGLCAAAHKPGAHYSSRPCGAHAAYQNSRVRFQHCEDRFARRSPSSCGAGRPNKAGFRRSSGKAKQSWISEIDHRRTGNGQLLSRRGRQRARLNVGHSRGRAIADGPRRPERAARAKHSELLNRQVGIPIPYPTRRLNR